MKPDAKDEASATSIRRGGPQRRTWLAAASVILVAMLWSGGCSGDDGVIGPPPGALEPEPPGAPKTSQAIVSDPVSAASAGSAGIASLQGNGPDIAYVSLPPGAIPGGEAARIRNLRTADSVELLMVDGGFDPVPIEASAGDTLEIEVLVSGKSSPLLYTIMVPPRRPPIVVRTDPPTGKKDVPLNAAIVIVFSEPIDLTTLTESSVQLRRGSTLVAGRIEFRDAAHLIAAFVPAAPLNAASEYELVLTPGIRDLDGDALEAPVTATFTTVIMFSAVSAANDHTCGVTTSGAAYCWGSNNYGQLGDGTTTLRTSPVAVSGGLTFATVSAGLSHSCGVTPSGAAYCWGDRIACCEGEYSIPQTSPVAVSGGLTFAAVSVGGGHNCGVTPSGAAYCWGRSGAGQLGDVSGYYQGSPVAVLGGLTFAAVSAGFDHTCGVTTSGAAYCWGNNDAGQLGDGTTTNRTSPVAVSGGLTFAAVSADGHHTCGVTPSGAAYCWGDNWPGQLGDGTTTNRTSPVAVSGGLTFAAVSAGYGHTCGVTSSGAAYCWGGNYRGQLGDGTTTDRTSPVAVSGGLTFAAVSAEGQHTCGVTPSGAAYCWGRNGIGQLGDGTTTDRTSPVAVSFP